MSNYPDGLTNAHPYFNEPDPWVGRKCGECGRRYVYDHKIPVELRRKIVYIDQDSVCFDGLEIRPCNASDDACEGFEEE